MSKNFGENYAVLLKVHDKTGIIFETFVKKEGLYVKILRSISEKPNAIVLVPEKELIILYKAMALIDRQFKLRTWANISKLDRDRLNSKIEKDKKDLKELVDSGIDSEKLQSLLKLAGFEKHFISAMKNIEPNWKM